MNPTLCRSASALRAALLFLVPNIRAERRRLRCRRWPMLCLTARTHGKCSIFIARRAGEWGIDPARIGGCGGSAGGFSVLWLAYHPDRAEAGSADPIARESTRLRCVLAFVPQTSLDPRRMREWIPNNDYGHHAFALGSYQQCLEKGEALRPWIAEFSPYALATRDDPPVLLFYDSVPAMGQAHKAPPHSANFGAGLARRVPTVLTGWGSNGFIPAAGSAR